MHPGERFNGYSHLLGLALALAGGVFLVGRAATAGDMANLAGALAFSLSAVALYGASVLFHGSHGRARLLWERADHCAIYLLIAGSYTPFALAAVPAGWGMAPLAGLWCFAASGIARELRQGAGVPPPMRLYAGMGWLCVLAAVPLAGRLGNGALAWLLAGAALYTAGLPFYSNRRGWRHAHGTWHLFVLGGTACHYTALAGFVL